MNKYKKYLPVLGSTKILDVIIRP